MDDDWVTAAMSDDSLVVEILVRLHATGTPSSSPAPRHRKTRTVPLEWIVRQRRSKSLSVVNNQKKQPQRASPKTPLTWSGATSLSGGSGGSGGGCYDESSAHLPPAKLSTAARSKIRGESEKTNSRRPRRKKTLSELREEESSLLQQRNELKRKITKLHIHLEKQRSMNEKLKKMKMEELETVVDTETQSAASVSHQKKTSTPPPLLALAEGEYAAESSFILPDLNIPFEEESASSCPELVCGVR